MRSPLAALDLALRTTSDMAGVHLSERPLAKVELRGDSRDAGFLRLVQETLGLLLPPVGTGAVTGAVTVFGLGPDEWLLTAPPGEGPALAARLDAATVERHGLALDASAAWTTLRLAGPAVIELLAGLVAIDLEPPAFLPGNCATTRLGSTRVVLVQIDDAPAFELHVPRSLAAGLWEQIAATARPFGVAVVPIPA